MKKHPSFWIPLAIVPLVLAACGGGDNAREVLSGADDTVSAVTTEPAPVDTDPVEPPATDAPVEPATTDIVTTTVASSEPAGDLAAFCRASEQFYVEATALNSIGVDADAAARALFLDMSVSVSGAIFNAPTEEVAAAPRQMQEVLAVLLPALESVDYDIDAVDGLANVDEVDAAFLEFGVILEQLETFLVGDCGSDMAALDSAAVDKGAEVSGSPVIDADTDPDTAVPDPDDSILVEDDSLTISLSVPSSWTDSDGTPDGELRRLVVAPDVAAFLAGFEAPGALIVTGDAVPGTGAEEGVARLDGLSSSVEADGCVLGSETPYDDGVYTGVERIYSCPGTDAVARFAGGSNSEGSIFWVLGIVYEPADADVWNLVTNSFLVD